MKVSLKYSLLLLYFGCSTIPQNTTQDESSLKPFYISSIESHFIETKYEIVRYTGSYPGKPIKKEIGFVYDIVFALRFQDEGDIWAIPFYLNIEYSDGQEQNIKFNEEYNIISNKDFPEFVIQIEVKNKDNIKATIGYEKGNGRLVFNKSNTFQSKIVDLE
jgi:hypothetical protein